MSQPITPLIYSSSFVKCILYCRNSIGLACISIFRKSFMGGRFSRGCALDFLCSWAEQKYCSKLRKRLRLVLRRVGKNESWQEKMPPSLLKKCLQKLSSVKRLWSKSGEPRFDFIQYRVWQQFRNETKLFTSQASQTYKPRFHVATITFF